MSDPVSAELRKVESQIDEAHLTNPLLQLPFAQSAWFFLAACEECRVVHTIKVINGEIDDSDQDNRALIDHIIVVAKWPMNWLLSGCDTGGAVRDEYVSDLYQAGMDLFKLSEQYQDFETVYTFASMGLLTLELDGQTIKASDEFREDPRYDAYDRLMDGPYEIPGELDLEPIQERIVNSVRVRGEDFTYALNPTIVRDCMDATEPMLASRFQLPEEWKLAEYTLGEFQVVCRVLWTLALIHSGARLSAAAQGCVGLGYARALCLFTIPELLARIVRYSGLSRRTVEAIVTDLTYGSRDMRNPDIALQPIVKFNDSHIGFAPELLTGLSLERNLVVLLNRLPEERERYAALSEHREELSRRKIRDSVENLGFRHWEGNVPEWDGESEVDLLVVSEEEGCALLLELKSFIQPAEAREIVYKSKEISTGIEQIQRRRGRHDNDPTVLSKTAGLPDGVEVYFAVASETSIGAEFVQCDDVAVVNVDHLIRRLNKDKSLRTVGRWLDAREYLPVAGKHFEAVERTSTMADFRLSWYGIRLLVEEFI